MLSFVLQKIRSKKWMVISLLLGNLLMVAIASAAPMYSQASAQRTLTRNLSDRMVETGEHPGAISASNSFAYLEKRTDEQNVEAYARIPQTEKILNQTIKELGVPSLMQVSSYYKNSVKAEPLIQADGKDSSLLITLTANTDLEEHVEVANGRMYSKELGADNTIEILINENTFKNRGLMLEQELELPKLLDESGQPYRIRIAGIYSYKDAQDPYWVSIPSTRINTCLMDIDLFKQLFINPEKPRYDVNATWNTVLDYTQFKESRVAKYIDILENLPDDAETVKASVSVNCTSVLKEFLPQYNKLNTTVWVLLFPIFVLLAVFVFMVSRQMLEMEQNEISVYKSRGATKSQIVRIYLLQSFYICAVGFIGGIPVGIFIFRVLGASNAFLEFVQRTALPLELNINVWLFAGLATFFSACTMVLPVFRFANVDIVDHKRQKNHVNKNSLWQVFILDLVLLGVSLYGLNQYNQQKEMLAQRVMEGASLDPLLYLCSSLFMVSGALMILWLFPLLVRFIFRIGRRWWSPVMYTSFLRVIRTSGNQGFLMVFLILMVSLGIFNAQTARTINANAQEKIQYMAGADIVLQEKWKSNKDEVILGGSSSNNGNSFGTGVIYEEPDFGVYLNMDGVKSATKVLVTNDVSVPLEEGKVMNVMLMGIHTKEFGETAWFKESLLPYHYHEYLNAISQNTSAILVSSNFRDLYGYEVGDVMSYSSSAYGSSSGVIYGFVDYWPSYAPYTTTKDTDGTLKQTDNFLVVAHLSHLQFAWGVTPYQIWIDAEDSTQFIYDHAEKTGTWYTLFRDAAAEQLAMKNDPVFQGTNGILTIGFVCVLLLCSVGFLIYWILSIQSRTLQFGIFRAMGMIVREIFSMLICEQVLITGVSLAAGILVGVLSSKLFVPLVQIAYSSADQVIPVEIISESSDYVRLFAVIGIVIMICMVILGVLISKIKISQALKLGED